jgi:hypothetical protein
MEWALHSVGINKSVVLYNRSRFIVVTPGDFILRMVLVLCCLWDLDLLCVCKMWRDKCVKYMNFRNVQCQRNRLEQ